MAAKPTPQQRRIEERLGVTHAGLHCLAKAITRPDGQAGGGPQAQRLLADGLLEHRDDGPPWARYITDTGRNVLVRAREMGW